MNITAEVGFKTLVYLLRLAIRLCMVGCAAAQFNISKAKELSPKMACEDSIAIRNDRLRKSMQAVDVGHEGLGHGHSSEWMAERNKVAILSEEIHDHQNAIEIGICRKAFDEVHGNGLPRRGRHRQGLEQTRGTSSVRFGQLTNTAVLNKILYC